MASAQQCSSDARSVVDAVYRQVLERNANGADAQAAAQLSSGRLSVRELVENVATSPEHRQRFGGANTDAGRRVAVTALYKHVLARAPDQGGLQSHVDALGRNDIDVVASSLVSSAEYQQKFGDETVPGQNLRLCTVASASDTSRFREMDRNGNGRIERGEWSSSNGSFDVHDWNRDGILSGNEVRMGARRYPNQDDPDFNPNTPTWSMPAFRQMDRNHDNRISSGEWYYDQQYFWRADRNRDGVLTPDEFTYNQRWDDDRDDRFENLDVDNNGRIERREWHGTPDAFDWLDRNHDQALSRAELSGPAPGAAQFDTFSSLDANRSGRIELDEWRWSRRSFARYDTDGDGTVTRREFTAGGGAPTAQR